METQVCILCKVEKPLTDYYAHPQMKNGRLGRCKVCHRAEISRNRNENIDRIREYDRKRNKDPMRMALHKKKNQRMNKRPFFMSAHNALTRAVAKGTVLRPDHCSKCLIDCVPQGHHDDYEKPLEVLWLCPICHAQRHKELGRLRTVENMKSEQ